jgi:ABC-type Zn uptake system ZnuABC Zn-binding protein ZnuA
MREVSPARVFLRVGLKLDDWGARLAAAGAPGITVLPLGDVLLEKGRLPDIDHVTSGSTGMCTHPPGEEHDHAHDHDSEGVNPHFWLDPVLAAHCVEEIRDVLSDIAPQHAPDFEANASRYLDELDALNRAISENLRHCSPREFVCFHNAFPYLANRYGLHISGIIEEYPGKTPSERYLKELTARLKELGVKTVFAEPQLSRRTADILAAEIGARVEILDPEGMQDAPDRNSYVKLMQYNADRLRRALCGTE